MAKAAYLMGKQILKIVKSRYKLYANPSFTDYNSGINFLGLSRPWVQRGSKDPKNDVKAPKRETETLKKNLK